VITEKLLEPLIKEIDMENGTVVVVERLALYRDGELLSILDINYKLSLEGASEMLSPIKDACTAALALKKAERLEAIAKEVEPS